MCIQHLELLRFFFSFLNWSIVDFQGFRCTVKWFSYTDLCIFQILVVAQLVKNHLQCRRPWFDFWVGKIPWRRNRLPTPVFLGFPGGSDHKESSCNAGDLGPIPGLGRSSGEGNGNPLQYSCLENSMNRGAWWATVHEVAKSRTWLSDFDFTLHYRLL